MGDFLNLVYDNWTGDGGTHRPNLENTLGPNRFKTVEGLFNFYMMLFKIRIKNIDDVYNNPDENFYYFINANGNSSHYYIEKNNIPLPKLVNECFLNCKNFNLVFINEHEYEDISFIKFIHTKSKDLGYDTKRIYIINNDSRLEEYKKEIETDINVYSLGFLLKFISGHLIKQNIEFKTEKEGKFFLCHNRSPKSHRYTLLVLLKNSGLINEVDWSLIMGWYRKENMKNGDTHKDFYRHFFNQDDLRLYVNEIEYFSSIDIKKSHFEENTSWFSASDLHDGFDWKDIYEIKSFQESYVNIVTESNFFNKAIHITEKSLKPFYFYQFPIFLASPNHVKYFKEKYGLDMFDDIIDHSYDNEIDDKKRLSLVYGEIKRIAENKDRFIEFYKNNKDRFEKNKQIIIEIEKSKKDVEYFTSLINKK